MEQENNKTIKLILKYHFLLFCFFVCLFFIGINIFLSSKNVYAMTSVSDLASITWPGATSSHVITFLTTADIPPSGSIVLTPEDSEFFIPVGFDFTDVDLATSTSRSGPYEDRQLAAAPTALLDGISVVDGSTSGSVTITLNSTNGIRSGTYVQIELGKVATHEFAGDLEWHNPANIDSYYIDIVTLSSSSALIKKARAMMAVVNPVTVSANFGKTRTEGAPSGYLSFGTTQTVLSLVSNFPATCRWSHTASTSYDDMVNEFAYTTGPSVFHSVLVADIDQANVNNYYVRCEDEGGGKNDVTDCIYEIGGNSTTTIATTCIDYLISFHVTTIENAVGDESGTPGPGGGGAGGGGGGGIGNTKGRGVGNLLPYPPLPENPGVAFTGWAYPNSEVVILKDGSDEGAIKANSGAEFGAFLPDLTQGVYTFGLWSEDSNGVRSETYSTTFWIDEGTQTVVSDIFLPPTISSNSDSIDIGDLLEVSGQTVPGSTVEIWLYPGQGSEISESKATKAESTADTYGNWAVSINTSGLETAGNYSVSARGTIADTTTKSDWGRTVSITVGGEPQEETGACEGADLNQDGKVNITDFSILLYYWNTDNDCADQNNSGNVDLIDFSIMLYYWTG